MSELVLPTKKVAAKSHSPRKLIIYSKPKVGKTSALAELPDALIIDLERGTDFLDAMKVQVADLAELRKVGEAIIAAGKPYKYVVVDTITKLEEMCLPLALSMYRKTPMGKNFDGSNVLTLPNGAGYLYLREAIDSVVKYIETLADRIIYLGHIKLKSIEKNGKEVTASDLDLTGKIKSMMSADVDAIGMLYREGNKNMLSFKTTDDIICGARPQHLKNQEVVLSEMDEKGNIKVNWDKVFID
jgi:hypothetical protein